MKKTKRENRGFVCIDDSTFKTTWETPTMKESVSYSIIQNDAGKFFLTKVFENLIDDPAIGKYFGPTRVDEIASANSLDEIEIQASLHGIKDAKPIFKTDKRMNRVIMLALLESKSKKWINFAWIDFTQHIHI